VDYNDSTYQIVVSIVPDSTTYVWRFTTKGSGYFDCWSHPTYTGTSNIIKTVNLPSVSVYPDVARYRAPDYLQNIVSSFQCSDHVLTVANYVNRSSFVNYSGDSTVYADTAGARVLTSSVGPTRDGRIKPDIAAPGGNTIAPGQISTLAQLIVNQPNKVAEGGMHNVNGGTSMASPVVGGIVALYLQKNPSASWYQVKGAIEMSAIQDAFTGSMLPDTKWGFGKIDAFGMLTTNIVYGCDDTAAYNYDSTVTVSLLDSCLYNSLLTRSTASLDINIYPNPTRDFVFIGCKLPEGKTHELSVTDVTGRVVYTAHFYHSINMLKMDVSNWQSGVYACSLFQNSKRLQTTKLVKL
jgi:subtilisin family serine protease